MSTENFTTLAGDIPFQDLTGFDQITKLTEAVRNAYYLKNRDIPANLSNMVETLRKQILKRIPRIGIKTLHENIESYIMNETTGAISTDVLFKAARRGYDLPKDRRPFDEDLPVRPDTEEDTIRLLDTLADTLMKGRKPYANWHREYTYLVHRRQLDLNSSGHFTTKAMAMLNAERAADRKPVVAYEEPHTVADDIWRSEALAVMDWIGSVLDKGLMPSDILIPLIDQYTYQQLRKTV